MIELNFDLTFPMNDKTIHLGRVLWSVCPDLALSQPQLSSNFKLYLKKSEVKELAERIKTSSLPEIIKGEFASILRNGKLRRGKMPSSPQMSTDTI